MKAASARLAWLLAGWVMVGLGGIGALLPVMPTTVFLIGALACFARASPALEQRLLQHPRYGQTLHAWRTRREIPRKAKLAAVLGMAVGLLIALVQGAPTGYLIALVVAEAGFSGWLLTRPEPDSTCR